ncbi:MULTISPECIES: nuclear transport factor 2 family protein [Microbacteriaceae]|uniref:Nuclear transport factor 2 family protein n=1 Tax=Gulosibacter molinativorax TaxID=256821 RepID=A0ABT7CBJ7_9MICO|nr:MULTISPECIES: nuclear transport factor 2 family protein [Microbacteriaceae]MDJ1372573.1 nuclear transport factor 2 family protein [Gulosibacter molinativorax]MDO8383117.1 nuclear transport factor 2 family protein [Microbacterium sp.]QUY61516.1 Hypotetical protein [Gulosibacter molinativorax]
MSTADQVSALPEPVGRLVAAINDADTDAFAACFTDDGYVDDWGRVLTGPQGVRSWAGSDAIGAGAQMTILTADTDGDTVTTRFSWRSRVFNGESTGIFTLSGGKIASFTIPPNH